MICRRWSPAVLISGHERGCKAGLRPDKVKIDVEQRDEGTGRGACRSFSRDVAVAGRCTDCDCGGARLWTLVRSFGFYYGTQHDLNYRSNVTIVVKDPATLKSDITTGLAAYDLFLSSSKDEPADLAKDTANLVVGKPFAYAVDSLVLFSPSVDVTAGLKKPFTTEFLIPDPDKDNYGEAVAQILASPPWIAPAPEWQDLNLHPPRPEAALPRPRERLLNLTSPDTQSRAAMWP